MCWLVVTSARGSGRFSDRVGFRADAAEYPESTGARQEHIGGAPVTPLQRPTQYLGIPLARYMQPAHGPYNSST
jgi:hypothetical protein